MATRSKTDSQKTRTTNLSKNNQPASNTEIASGKQKTSTDAIGTVYKSQALADATRGVNDIRDITRILALAVQDFGTGTLSRADANTLCREARALVAAQDLRLRYGVTVFGQ